MSEQSPVHGLIPNCFDCPAADLLAAVEPGVYPLTFARAIDIGSRGLRYHRDIRSDQGHRLCGYIRKELREGYGDHEGFTPDEVAHKVGLCLVKRCADDFDPTEYQQTS